MVKGISRQVIVVKSPDEKMFEQAIFILRADAEDVGEEALLKQAQQAARTTVESRWMAGPLWAAGGAVCTAVIWLLTTLL